MDVSTFKILYTQFSNLADEVIASRLDDFNLYFSNFKFGKYKDKAQGLFVAHLLTIQEYVCDSSSAPGVARGGYVEQESTPEFTVKYATSKGILNDDTALNLKSTIYGQELLLLLKIISPVSRLGAINPICFGHEYVHY